MKGCENIFWMSFIRRQCKGAATLRRAINIWQTLFANVCHILVTPSNAIAPFLNQIDILFHIWYYNGYKSL